MFNKKTILSIALGIIPVAFGLGVSFNIISNMEKAEDRVNETIVMMDNFEQKIDEELAKTEEEDDTSSNELPKELIVISEAGLNVRDTPDKVSSVVTTYPFTKPVEIIDVDVDGEWYKTEDGYIYGEYVMERDKAIEEKIISESDIEKYKRLHEGYEMELNVDVTGISGLNINDVCSYTKEHPGLVGIEKAVIDAEYEYGINAFVSLAVASLESGHGSSDIAVYKNNLYGMNAQDHDPFELAYTYDSKHESAMDFAKRLKTYYIDKGLTTLDKIQAKYCPSNSNWDESVEEVMEDIYNTVLSNRQ